MYSNIAGRVFIRIPYVSSASSFGLWVMEYGILMICYSAGGQYHWVAGKSYHTIFAEFITDVQQLVSIISIGRLYNSNRIVSWERWMPILSWITGWANVSGWVKCASYPHSYKANRSGRLGCYWWTAGQRTSHWRYFLYAPSKSFYLLKTSHD